MRPMYEIVEMIRSHYANDDDKFNNYAKTIIDYYEKEGNLAGADEIREIITTGHSIPRTSEPKLVTCMNPDNKSVNRNDIQNHNIKSNIYTPELLSEHTDIQIIKHNKDKNKSSENTPEVKPKRHRRTKAEMTAARLLESESQDNNKKDIAADIEKPKKRHRRTKAEMEAARATEIEKQGKTNNTNNMNNTNDKNNTNLITEQINKPKRHRRTKAEMAAARSLENNEVNRN